MRNLAEINERGWEGVLLGLEWALAHNANPRDEPVDPAVLKITARPNYRLRCGIVKDARGRHWGYTSVPNRYRLLEADTVLPLEEIPAPYTFGPFPAWRHGWERCPPGASEEPNLEAPNTSIEEANATIRAFAKIGKEHLTTVMIAYAAETREQRTVHARKLKQGLEPGEGEWTNVGDTRIIAVRLGLSKTSVERAFISEGKAVCGILNWLEELSGLEPANYLR